jgi:hypothetical protein
MHRSHRPAVALGLALLAALLAIPAYAQAHHPRSPDAPEVLAGQGRTPAAASVVAGPLVIRLDAASGERSQVASALR